MAELTFVGISAGIMAACAAGLIGFLSFKIRAKWKEKKNNTTFYLWLAGISTISLIGCLWSKEIIVTLTPDRFHPSAVIVPIILFSYVFEGVYYFVSKPIFFYKRTRILPFTTGSAALVNIVLNLLFIPRWGILGAAYATAISSVFMAVIVYLAGRRLFDPCYDVRKVVLVLLVLFGLGVLIRFETMSPSVELVKTGILLGFVCLTYFCFRDYLPAMFWKAAGWITRR